MYGTLTFRELTVLQKILYKGTEKAFRITNLRRSDSNWLGLLPIGIPAY